MSSSNKSNELNIAMMKIIFEQKDKSEVELSDIKELLYKLELFFTQIIKIKTNHFFIVLRNEKDLKYLIEALDDFFIEEHHAYIQIYKC